MSSPYFQFMHKWNREHGYNSFYGSNKRAFLGAWRAEKEKDDNTVTPQPRLERASMEAEDVNRAEPFAERQQRIAAKSTNVVSQKKPREKKPVDPRQKDITYAVIDRNLLLMNAYLRENGDRDLLADTEKARKYLIAKIAEYNFTEDEKKEIIKKTKKINLRKIAIQFNAEKYFNDDGSIIQDRYIIRVQKMYNDYINVIKPLGGELKPVKKVMKPLTAAEKVLLNPDLKQYIEGFKQKVNENVLNDLYDLVSRINYLLDVTRLYDFEDTFKIVGRSAKKIKKELEKINDEVSNNFFTAKMDVELAVKEIDPLFDIKEDNFYEDNDLNDWHYRNMGWNYDSDDRDWFMNRLSDINYSPISDSRSLLNEVKQLIKDL